MRKTVYEKPSETAKKIRKVLKENFPGTKFSVRTHHSSVYVTWTNGPTKKEVQEIVDRFSSASFDGMQDLETVHGYIWEGVRYIGAKYIFLNRIFSEDYEEELFNYMREQLPHLEKSYLRGAALLEKIEEHYL